MDTLSKKNPIKLCILGNSHVGSLKQGWDLIADDYPEISITFFAARASGMDYLSVHDGLLVPTTDVLKTSLSHTSGGFEQIDLSLFDMCLIYGLRFTFPYRLEIDRANNKYSKAVYDCAAYDRLNNSLAMKVLNQVRLVSQIPLYMGHCPLVAFNSKSRLHSKIHYSEFINTINRTLINKQAVLLAQPEETIVENMYTKADYKSGATCIDVGDSTANKLYSTEDNLHMNGIFGSIYLKHFFESLKIA